MPRPKIPRLSALPRLGWPLAALSATWFMVGCARIPVTDEPPQPRPSHSFQSAEALRAPATVWPDLQWWTAYGDPQLDRLIQEALADAPDLAAALARLQRSDARVQFTGSANKPQITANAAITESKISYNNLVPAQKPYLGWNDNGLATLDMTWEMDFWGKHRAALAAATSEREARRAELAQARLMLAAGVAAEYAEWSRLFANRATAAKAVAIRQKTAALFAQRLANGLETRGSSREADARRAMAESTLMALDEQIALQRNRLAALVGAGPDRGLAMTAPNLRLDRHFGLPAELDVDLIGRRPDIVAARLQAEAMASRVKQKKTEFYPNVNLSAMIGIQSLDLNMLTKSGSSLASVGPALSLPIFSAGRLRGELRGAQAGYAEAVAAYNGTVIQALREVADNAVSQKALGPRLLKAQEAVEAATEAHVVAGNRYRGGLANYLEVLSAEEILLNSLNAQSNLACLSWTLDIGLQRALGGGYQVTRR